MRIPKYRRSLLGLLQRFRAQPTVLGVEVGVAGADLSALLLEKLPRLYLHLVDLWAPVEPTAQYALSADRMARMTPAQWADLYQSALARLHPFLQRYTIHRAASLEVAERLAQRLDFAFIDADHSYEGTRDDAWAWYHVLRPGGLLAGHDYNSRRYPGVARAVLEFTAEKQLDLQQFPGHVWACWKPEA